MTFQFYVYACRSLQGLSQLLQFPSPSVDALPNSSLTMNEVMIESLESLSGLYHLFLFVQKIYCR